MTDAQLLEPLGESFYTRPGSVQYVPRPIQGQPVAIINSNHRFSICFSNFFVETHAFESPISLCAKEFMMIQEEVAITSQVLLTGALITCLYYVLLCDAMSLKVAGFSS